MTFRREVLQSAKTTPNFGSLGLHPSWLVLNLRAICTCWWTPFGSQPLVEKSVSEGAGNVTPRQLRFIASMAICRSIGLTPGMLVSMHWLPEYVGRGPPA